MALRIMTLSLTIQIIMKLIMTILKFDTQYDGTQRNDT
jgi:hypothetical protein